MNTETKLVELLDELFGSEKKIRSRYKVIDKQFDDKTNELIVTIEYRYLETSPAISKKPVDESLIQEINAQAG